MQKILHSVHGDFRRRFVGKMKFAGGDAAERDAVQPVFRCQLQTGTIAVCQQFRIPLGHAPFDDGSHGVNHIPAQQVICGRDLCPSGRFRRALRFHDLRTGGSQLHAREGVYCVIDAAVIGHIAAGHAGIRGVDDRIAAW